MYKMQIRGDIFSISEVLWNIIQEKMEEQAYYIQVLLADELDRCKDKGNKKVGKHQNDSRSILKNTLKTLQLIDIDK